MAAPPLAVTWTSQGLFRWTFCSNLINFRGSPDLLVKLSYGWSFLPRAVMWHLQKTCFFDSFFDCETSNDSWKMFDIFWMILWKMLRCSPFLFSLAWHFEGVVCGKLQFFWSTWTKEGLPKMQVRSEKKLGLRKSGSWGSKNWFRQWHKSSQEIGKPEVSHSSPWKMGGTGRRHPFISYGGSNSNKPQGRSGKLREGRHLLYHDWNLHPGSPTQP